MKAPDNRCNKDVIAGKGYLKVVISRFFGLLSFTFCPSRWPMRVALQSIAVASSLHKIIEVIAAVKHAKRPKVYALRPRNTTNAAAAQCLMTTFCQAMRYGAPNSDLAGDF